jgi:quinol monooxygenase YgiN
LRRTAVIAGRTPQPRPEEIKSIFARFHSLEGKEEAVASELRDAVIRVRTEPGCLGIEVYGSVRDPRLFWLHSRWVDEAAFDKHVERPATNQFVERVQRVIDHPFDVTRTRVLR